MRTEKQKIYHHTKSEDKATVKSDEVSISEYERKKILEEVEEALRELNALKEHLMVGR